MSFVNKYLINLDKIFPVLEPLLLTLNNILLH